MPISRRIFVYSFSYRRNKLFPVKKRGEMRNFIPSKWHRTQDVRRIRKNLQYRNLDNSKRPISIQSTKYDTDHWSLTFPDRWSTTNDRWPMAKGEAKEYGVLRIWLQQTPLGEASRSNLRWPDTRHFNTHHHHVWGVRCEMKFFGWWLCWWWVRSN